MEALAGLGPVPDGHIHGAAAGPRTATTTAPPVVRSEHTLEPQPERIAPPAQAHAEHRRERHEEHVPAPPPRMETPVQRAPEEQFWAQPDHSDVPYRRRPSGAPAPAETARPARKPSETKIFVPPRAPDDPGPGPADADDLGPVALPASGAKA